MRYTKGDKFAGNAGVAQAARHTAGSKAERKEKKRGSVGCVYTKGVESRRKKVVVDSKKRGRRGSGAGVSAGVAETGVRPFNRITPRNRRTTPASTAIWETLYQFPNISPPLQRWLSGDLRFS